MYIAGPSPRSMSTIENLTRLCEDRLPGQYRIDVIDLKTAPLRAKADQIVAVPTIVRRKPTPERKVIGNLADVERAVAGLELPQS